MNLISIIHHSFKKSTCVVFLTFHPHACGHVAVYAVSTWEGQPVSLSDLRNKVAES